MFLASNLLFLAAVIVVAAGLAIGLPRLVGRERTRALGESPWLWGVMFLAAAAVSLLAVGPKYQQREERRLRMREAQEQVVARAQRAAQNQGLDGQTVDGASPDEIAAPRRFLDQPETTLVSLGLGIAGLLLVATTALALRGRWG